MRRLITSRCHSVINFCLKSLFASMNVSKVIDGRVHVRNSGLKGLTLIEFWVFLKIECWLRGGKQPCTLQPRYFWPIIRWGIAKLTLENVLSDNCAQQRFRSTCTLVQSDQYFPWTHFGQLVKDACYSMRTTKTLIRLRGCAGWFESSFAVHVYQNVRFLKFLLIPLL